MLYINEINCTRTLLDAGRVTQSPHLKVKLQEYKYNW